MRNRRVKVEQLGNKREECKDNKASYGRMNNEKRTKGPTKAFEEQHHSGVSS